MSRTLRFEPLADTADEYAKANGWPHTIIGVFPSQENIDAEGVGPWNWFNYTVGLDVELWCPSESIEGRAAGNDLISWIVNALAVATLDHVVRPGDSVLVPLGVPGSNYPNDPTDFTDFDAVFWLGEVEPNTGRRCTYQSPAEWVMPILWSSPLGWEEES
jgi:hypothetical protein